MFLHAGGNIIINEKKIVMIINAKNIKQESKGIKSVILLKDGARYASRINSATLKRRIEERKY